MLAAAITSLGCGPNNPGDPVDQARALAAPIPKAGGVDVYCVIAESPKVGEDEDCLMLLRGGSDLPDQAFGRWWRRMVEAVSANRSKIVENEGKKFRFDRVAIYRHRGGQWIASGWVCRSDEQLTDEARQAKMDNRAPDGSAPLDPSGVRAGGCKIAPYSP